MHLKDLHLRSGGWWFWEREIETNCSKSRIVSDNLKQILFQEWMEINCPNARFLLNAEDDVFANTVNMVEYFQSLEDNNGSKHLFTACLIQNVGPIKSSRSMYFIPVQVQESDSYASCCPATQLWSYTVCPSPLPCLHGNVLASQD